MIKPPYAADSEFVIELLMKLTIESSEYNTPP